MRRRYFQVRGNGSFPFRLLSQDECYPANTAEAAKIELACPTVAPEQTIMMCTVMEGAPHTSLWRAAKWPVQLVE
jgi:hypothetical protein